MVEYNELLKTLETTEIVYKNNYTKDANFVYFDELFDMWTSNAMDDVTVEEMIITHSFKNLPFSNVGIPTKELLQTLKTMGDSVVIEQKEDHILLTTENKKAEIVTVKYVEPAPFESNVNIWAPLPCKTKPILKVLTEFMDKNAEDARYVQLQDNMIYSTDINSVQGVEVVEGGWGKCFAVTPEVFAILDHFDSICVSNYLYLKSEDGTKLVTAWAEPMNMEFINDYYDERAYHADHFQCVEFPTFKEDNLLKIFSADTKKPDRILHVEIDDNDFRVSVSNVVKGNASIKLETVKNEGLHFNFNIDTTKFLAICRDYNKVMLYEDLLWAEDSLGDIFIEKFVMVDVIK